MSDFVSGLLAGLGLGATAFIFLVLSRMRTLDELAKGIERTLTRRATSRREVQEGQEFGG